ncbi:MAG: Lrp/AsnC ligand binding domain-containing protein [Gammaproteobacteria bacterium]|nr:Lrp/AsnC ligand binding domain-containing protein [Gammaproteobacteria bacterium]
MTLDRIDKLILKMLQKNGRLTNIELAEKIASSKTVCWNRTKRLFAEGYIQSIRAVLNPNKLGLSVLVTVGVILDRSTPQSFSEFEKAVIKIPAVIECLLLAGEFDYWLKIRVKNIQAFNRLHANELLLLPGVRQLRTFFALGEVKVNSELSIEL